MSAVFVALSRCVTRFPDAISALAPRLRFLRSQQVEKHKEITFKDFSTQVKLKLSVSIHFLFYHWLHIVLYKRTCWMESVREGYMTIFFHCVPLHRPGHSDGEFLIGAQHFYQVFSAGWTDGPQRVGAAFQFCDVQVLCHVALQPLQGFLFCIN